MELSLEGPDDDIQNQQSVEIVSESDGMRMRSTINPTPDEMTFEIETTIDIDDLSDDVG